MYLVIDVLKFILLLSQELKRNCKKEEHRIEELQNCEVQLQHRVQELQNEEKHLIQSLEEISKSSQIFTVKRLVAFNFFCFLRGENCH